MTATGWSIPPLRSGGVMLTYRCTNACRHCLYRCSPAQPDEWLEEERAEQVFGALARERELSGIHLAGGEATLDPDRLEAAVRRARAHGLRISYLETNGHWCETVEAGIELFERLREAGLPGILASVSCFHNEFIPLRRMKNCIAAGERVFGRGGVFVYLPQMLEMLSALEEETPHSLDEFCRALGWMPLDPRLTEVYAAFPNGRAASALRRCFTPHSAETYAGGCRRELMSTGHFHIDPYGNLFTGLCPGLAAGTAEDLHPRITREAFPITHCLAEEGPLGLARLAGERHGFAPRAEGYVSRCDLCLDVRAALCETGAYKELRPEAYYR